MSRSCVSIFIASVFLVAHQAIARRGSVANDTVRCAEASLAYYDILHSTSTLQSFNLTGQDYLVKAVLPLADGTLAGTLRRSMIQFNSRSSKTPIDVSLSSEIQTLTFIYQTSLGNLAIEAGMNLVDEHRHIAFYGNGSIALKFPMTVVEEIRLGVQQQALPFDFRVVYLDSELPILQTSRQTSIESSVALALIPNNRAEIQYTFSGSSPATEHNPFLWRDNTEIRSWNVSTRQGFRNLEIKLSFDRTTVQSSTDFFRDETNFGESTLSEAMTEGISLRCVSPSLSHQSDFTVRAGYRILKGTLVGNLQSWPFYSVLQSVIANRINFRLGGSVEYWEAGIEHSWHFESFYVRPSVTYYDAKPDLSIQSWQPLFLVVGVSQFTDNQLDIVHVGLAQLEIAVGMSTVGIRAELRATQFLPLFQDRRVVQEGVGAPPPGPAGESQTSTKGGRWINLTLRTTI